MGRERKKKTCQHGKQYTKHRIQYLLFVQIEKSNDFGVKLE